MAVRASQAGADLALLVEGLLAFLQVRNKWSKPQPDIKVNDLVIRRNPQLPPSRWELVPVV
jgi:hypothetical protein